MSRIRLDGATLNVHISSTGNDTTGDGSALAPFLTPQKAVYHVHDNYDLNGGAQVNFKLMDDAIFPGFSIEGPFTGQRAAGHVVFQGNNTPGNYYNRTISGGIRLTDGALMDFQGLRMTGASTLLSTRRGGHARCWNIFWDNPSDFACVAGVNSELYWMTSGFKYRSQDAQALINAPGVGAHWQIMGYATITAETIPQGGDPHNFRAAFLLTTEGGLGNFVPTVGFINNAAVRSTVRSVSAELFSQVRSNGYVLSNLPGDHLASGNFS